MGRQGGVEGWEKQDNPQDEYLAVWSTYPKDHEIRTEQEKRRFPVIVRVWDEIDGEDYAVETEHGRSDTEELNASRRTYSSEEDARQEAKRRMRRINEDSRLFGGYLSDDELDEVIYNIKHNARNDRQLGSRLQELGKKIKRGSKKRERERNSRV